MVRSFHLTRRLDNPAPAPSGSTPHRSVFSVQTALQAELLGQRHGLIDLVRPSSCLTLQRPFCRKFAKTLGYADAAFISLHKSVRWAIEVLIPREASGQKLPFLAVDHFLKWEILAKPESPALGSASLGTTMTGLQLSCSPFLGERKKRRQQCIAVYRSMQIWKQSRKRQEHCCVLYNETMLLQSSDTAHMKS